MKRILLGLLWLTACTGTPDTDTETDTDTDTDTNVDPLDGQGVLSGECGELGPEEFDSSDSFFFRNTLTFEEPLDEENLSEGGEKVLNDGNLGGSSIWSEVFSFEVLYRCELATLEKTEAEIDYNDPGGKKTDLLVEIDGYAVGVSVTRAYAWPPEEPYTLEQATALLEDKLADIPLSTANVSSEDMWTRQILHVLAYTPEHASRIQESYESLSSEIKGDTILFVTETEGDDAFMY